MRQPLILIAFTVFSGIAFAKGVSGTYYISGIAFGPRGEVLTCSELAVKMGNDIDTIQTNEKGEFEIKIFWMGPCPSVKHPPNYNPKYIDIKFGTKKIRFIIGGSTCGVLIVQKIKSQEPAICIFISIL